MPTQPASPSKREKTTVADGSLVYREVVSAPSGMKAVVQPATSTFARKYSKAKFQLTVASTLKVITLGIMDS
ncbi:hypothetical protein CRYUN_Cryun06bG0051500 [Craigia yunnanensis]